MIKSGASLTQKGIRGTAKETAENCKQTEILEIINKLDEISSSESSEMKINIKERFKLIINGNKFSAELIEKNILLIQEKISEIDKKLKNSLLNHQLEKARTLTNKTAEWALVLRILQLNLSAFSFQQEKTEDFTQAAEDTSWKGYLYIRGISSGSFDHLTWPRCWFLIQNTSVSYFTCSPDDLSVSEPITRVGSFSLNNFFSFKLYPSFPHLFSLISFSKTTLKHHGLFLFFLFSFFFFLFF